MCRKAVVIVLIVLMMLPMVSCSSKTKDGTIRFFKSYNESTGELSEPTEYIKAGNIEYVFFDYGKPFNSSTIGLTVFEKTENGKMSMYDYIMDIDPESTSAVFPVEIYQAAEYEMVIYFDDPENPIA